MGSKCGSWGGSPCTLQHRQTLLLEVPVRGRRQGTAARQMRTPIDYYLNQLHLASWAFMHSTCQLLHFSILLFIRLDRERDLSPAG